MLNAFTTLAARLCLGTYFLFAAFGQVITPKPQIARLADAGFPLPTFSFWTLLGMQVAASVLIILGAKTRPAAWLLAVLFLATNMYLSVRSIHPPSAEHILADLALGAGLLLITVSGPGPLSLGKN